MGVGEGCIARGASGRSDNVARFRPRAWADAWRLHGGFAPEGKVRKSSRQSFALATASHHR
jgi:hypothetical protein